MKAIAAHAVNAGPRRDFHEMFKSEPATRAALNDWSGVRVTEFTQTSRFTDAGQ
jgi:hypothetical protein